MASKQDRLALEAVRHFKEAQLAAWLGDTSSASREFEKCSRAIALLEEQGEVRGFHELAKLAKLAPRQTDHRINNTIKARFSADGGYVIPVTYTLIPQGSNKAEFRARIHWHFKRLLSAVNVIRVTDDSRLVVNERALQWIEVNQKLGFSGIFLLTYADGTIYAQISTHQFLDRISLDEVREELMRLVADKLLLIRLSR